jgi:hypothetical protein
MSLISRRSSRVLDAIHQLDRKWTKIMEALLAALAKDKEDREAFVTAVLAEFTKLEGEIENPAALEKAKQLVEAEDEAIKAVVIPTA